MGQYYIPSVLRKNWKTAKNPVLVSLKCYDFGNGAKLMEHSYIGNSFVRSMEFLLANDFKGHPFVWCGDYADHVETRTGEHDIYRDASLFIYEDYDSPTNDKKSRKYLALKDSIPAMPEWKEGKKWNPYETIPYYKYLVNYTKKQYCIVPEFDDSTDEYQVHPLPLLTCSGNGRGGGDYHIDTDERVGSWAFDKIGLTNDEDEVAGFKEIDGFFKLDY
jgi:hypothetical protein